MGFLLLEGSKIIRRFSQLIKIDQEIPLPIQQLTGIYSTQEGRSLERVLPILKYLESYPIFCHNAAFEESFLRPYLPQAKFVDTVYFFMLLYPLRESYALESFIQDFSLARKEIHRGYEDARDLYFVLEKAVQESNKKELFKGTPYEFLFDVFPKKEVQKFSFNKKSFEDYFSEEERKEAYFYVHSLKTKNFYLKRSSQAFVFRKVLEAYLSRQHLNLKKRELTMLCPKVLEEQDKKEEEKFYLQELLKEDFERDQLPGPLNSSLIAYIQESSCLKHLCSYYPQCGERKKFFLTYHQVKFFEKECLQFSQFHQKDFSKLMFFSLNEDLERYILQIREDYRNFLKERGKKFDYFLIQSRDILSVLKSLEKTYDQDNLFHREALFYVQKWIHLFSEEKVYFYEYKNYWSFKGVVLYPFHSDGLYFLDTALPVENKIYHDFFSLIFFREVHRGYLEEKKVKMTFHEKKGTDKILLKGESHLEINDKPFLPKSPWINALGSLYRKEKGREDFDNIRLGIDLFQTVSKMKVDEVSFYKGSFSKDFLEKYLFPFHL